MQRLTAPGRAIRVAVTLLVGALLIVTTAWGDDDHFPFAPFKMYAGAATPDQATIDTRVEAVDVTGRTVLLTERNSGMRRAEIEGQLERLRQSPELLRLTADAYADHNPGAPRLHQVRVVVRWHEVRDFQPTGQWEDEVVAEWAR